MEKYIIIIKDVIEFPHIKTDMYGRPLQFNTIEEASEFIVNSYEEILKITY